MTADPDTPTTTPINAIRTQPGLVRWHPSKALRMFRGMRERFVFQRILAVSMDFPLEPNLPEAIASQR
ncbi:hypothetical protein N7451_002338 [Penicillium sp. IBT 35674x]|nr:hypothetical protein N7451_002338 [Penicillium sp. IBT 35674x]